MLHGFIFAIGHEVSAKGHEAELVQDTDQARCNVFFFLRWVRVTFRRVMELRWLWTRLPVIKTACVHQASQQSIEAVVQQFEALDLSSAKDRVVIIFHAVHVPDRSHRDLLTKKTWMQWRRGPCACYCCQLQFG